MRIKRRRMRPYGLIKRTVITNLSPAEIAGGGMYGQSHKHQRIAIRRSLKKRERRFIKALIQSEIYHGSIRSSFSSNSNSYYS